MLRSKIISYPTIKSTISSIRKAGKSTVITGGCFDIIHLGHIKFLKEAKKGIDFLVVLLESDTKVKKIKGNKRPYFTQKERAEVLSALRSVDYVFLLPFMKTDSEYDRLIRMIKPDVVAVTSNDPILNIKKVQADSVNAKLKIVQYMKTYSSSFIADLLGID
jgi:rfaE bifunctional protein nucleotidyltransferase chain/domain